MVGVDEGIGIGDSGTEEQEAAKEEKKAEAEEDKERRTLFSSVVLVKVLG